MRKQKLLEHLTNNPKNATFDDLRALLFYEGFELERVTGSHHIFKKGRVTFAIPSHRNKVKEVYVKRVIEIVEESDI